MGRCNSLLKCAAPVLFCLLVVSRVSAHVPDTYLPNYKEGYGVGYTSGYDTGYTSGSERGTKEGTTKGSSDGYSDGWNAAYQPAYDAAYQANLPVGQSAGFDAGLPAGIRSGFDWATQTYGSMISSGSLSVNLIGSDWSGGSLFVSGWLTTGNNAGGSGTGSAGISMMSGGGSEDLRPYYYQLGYDDGKAIGLTDGGTAGYDFAYPKAYAAAYDTGLQTGTLKGTTQGSSDGKTEGYSAGWSSGYDLGYGQGYNAGIDLFLAGGTLPATSTSAANTSVPEPASLSLLAIAAVAFVCRGSRK